AQVERLQLGKGVIGALDQQYRLPWIHRVAVVQRMHPETGPLLSAELEDGNGLVDAAEERVLLAKHLHGDVRAVAVCQQDLPGPHEVLVGVVAGPHPLDREVEDCGIEARAMAWFSHASSAGGRCTELRPLP